MIAPHDGQHKIGLSRIQACDHPHASPEIYQSADSSLFWIQQNFGYFITFLLLKEYHNARVLSLLVWGYSVELK